MSEDNLVLEHLRHIRGVVDQMSERLAGVGRRLTNVEVTVSHLHTVLVEQQVTLDRWGARLERLERRAELL